MKKLFLSCSFLLLTLFMSAQNYPNIVNHYYNGTPAHGVKIKTNLPFKNSHHMPTIKIEGFDYETMNVLSLTIVWYIHNDSFLYNAVSSSGSAIPDVWLCNENGKVSIFLDEKIYFQRFTVSAFSAGTSDNVSNYQEWTVVDEPLAGTHQKKVSYKNNFGGNVNVAGKLSATSLSINPESKIGCYLDNQTFKYDNKIMGHYAMGWFSDSWDPGSPTLWLSSYGGIKLFTGSQPSMTINSSGNVGIGMPASSIKLDVNGTIRTNDQIYIEVSGNNGIGGKISLINNEKTGSNEAHQWTIFNMSGDYGNSLQFWAYDNAGCAGGLCASRFTIMDNGNVGIGTTDPQYKLDVKGTIRATEVKIESVANFPDYVFTPGYNLRSLDEVNNYIKINGHLPEIPSAEEVKEQGMNMAEMQVKLLQKIEELTLYTIKQQELLDEYKECISRQQQDIDELKK